MSCAKTLCLGLLVAALAVAGCGDKGAPKKDKDTEAKDSGKKGHTHGKGPNGGVVFDFGAHHAEFDIKHDKKQCVVTVLGDDEKTPLPVACEELTVVTRQTKGKKGEVVKPMTITLKPVDAREGKASKFVGADPGLGIEAEHEGKVFGTVNGKQAEGEFKED
jgi:hypothetical protein